MGFWAVGLSSVIFTKYTLKVLGSPSGLKSLIEGKAGSPKETFSKEVGV